jgi:hypothetical protein
MPSRRFSGSVSRLALLAAFAWSCGPAEAQTVRSKRPGEISEFLRLPGEAGDPYGQTDWSSLPPWRQASFFGVRARGQVFVFVVDCSGSMADNARLVRAKAELRRTINGLRWPQRFQVIFYNDRPFVMPVVPETADLKSKRTTFAAFQAIDAEGQTDPRGAMKRALGMKPDAVFLLSDGLFPDGSVEAILAANPNKVPIHCIDLAGGAASPDLKRIAQESGGQYAIR